MAAVRRARPAPLAVLAVIFSEFSATISTHRAAQPRPRPLANRGTIKIRIWRLDPHCAQRATAAHGVDRGNAPARVVAGQQGLEPNY